MFDPEDRRNRGHESLVVPDGCVEAFNPATRISFASVKDEKIEGRIATNGKFVLEIDEDVNATMFLNVPKSL